MISLRILPVLVPEIRIKPRGDPLLLLVEVAKANIVSLFVFESSNVRLNEVLGTKEAPLDNNTRESFLSGAEPMRFFKQ